MPAPPGLSTAAKVAAICRGAAPGAGHGAARRRGQGVGGRAWLSPLSALTDTETPAHFSRKWKYKGSCAVSPLKRRKCKSATSLQLLAVEEDMEIEPVSDVLGEEEEERAGVKRRGDSLPTSGFFQLKHLTSDGKTELIQGAKKIAA